ncbi:DUF5908 family protein [Pseudomonas sp. NPDC090755]|uniref:DUF5908 family protein n=1 Tax=Pseudomonas sp. NPDC090755 TaxID=3364481 RepID=UPI00383A58C6
MPIEIRELHIRVAVTPPQGATASPAPAVAADKDNEHVQQALVAECVEQVLRILQNKTER